MEKRIRSLIALVIVAALALSLCACSNSAAPSQSNDNQTSSNNSQTQEAPAEKPEEGMSLKEDIVMGMTYKHSSLDAAESGTNFHSYLWRMMLDTLLRINYETQELEPRLAESWSMEDEGKTFTFKLRDGVKFHNGETLKASDVVFTFQRMDGTSFGNTLFTKLESIEAVDDLTVKMTLKENNMDWPYLLTLPYAGIMNEKAVNDDPTEGTAVGTGPWKLDSYEFGNYTKLTAFEESWRGAPNAKTFTFRTIPEASARLIALQNNEIDICDNPPAIEYGIIESDPNLDLYQFNSTSLTYFAFNTQKAPGNNPDFRKAVAYALDIDSLIAVALEGNATKANSVWGWNQYGYKDMGGFTQDLDLAKEYLAKAYPNGGATLDISVMGATHMTMAEMIQEQLRQIGITVTISEYDAAGIKQVFKNGEHEACTFAMGMSIYGDDTRRFLQPGLASNTAMYNNEYVIDLMNKAMRETDEAQRLEYYAQVQEDLYENVPYIPLYYAISAIATQAGVGGLGIDPTSHHDFSNIFVPVK